jgi:hypothetical protein
MPKLCKLDPKDQEHDAHEDDDVLHLDDPARRHAQQDSDGQDQRERDDDANAPRRRPRTR